MNSTTLHWVIHSFLKILTMGSEGEELRGDRDAIASSRIGEIDGESCKDDIVLFLFGRSVFMFFVVFARNIILLSHYLMVHMARHPSH